MTTRTKHGYSKIEAFEACPRFYYYRYERHLEPKKFNENTSFGSLFHLARQVYYETGNDLQAAYQAIKMGAAEYLMYEGFHEKAEDLVLYVADAIEAYSKHYKDDKIERIAFEVPFETEIGDKPWPITGRLDGVVVADREVWVEEVKTTGWPIATFVRQMTLDGKTTCYVWAARKITGRLVQGALLDIVYKKRNQSGFDFHREVLPRTDFNIQEWHDATVYKLKQIDECREKGVWPHNYKQCGSMYGKTCPYIDVCRFGETPELIAAQFMQVDEPDEEGGGE